MGKFGGQTKFGSGHFGGDRSPTPIGYIIRRMVASMSGLVSTGSMKTVARLYGDPRRRETWDAVLTPGGIPAVLIHYAGGTFEVEATSGARLVRHQFIDVYCFAGDYRSSEHRYEGKHAADPAIENITAWCVYRMGRALLDLKHFRNARPVDEKPFVAGSNAVGYVLRFAGSTSLDLYDDAIALKLESLGICHSPTDANILFESNNVTPKSGDEPVPATNVADLTE
jgi:hypothetical protein